METKSSDVEVEPIVHFDYKTDRYEGVINGELLTAKWCNHSDSFVAILKETNPLPGLLKSATLMFPSRTSRAESRMKVMASKSACKKARRGTRFSPPDTLLATTMPSSVPTWK